MLPICQRQKLRLDAVPKPLLGTDNLGRDIAKRIVHGARISLYVGIVVELISLLIGIPLGAIAGYYGGKLDDIIMRFTDIMLSFPSLLLAMAVMTILGRDIINVFIALGIVSWPSIARIVRGQFISIREAEYVEASRAVGCSNARIIIKHILPNTLAPIIVLYLTWHGIRHHERGRFEFYRNRCQTTYAFMGLNHQ